MNQGLDAKKVVEENLKPITMEQVKDYFKVDFIDKLQPVVV